MNLSRLITAGLITCAVSVLLVACGEENKADPNAETTENTSPAQGGGGGGGGGTGSPNTSAPVAEGQVVASNVQPTSMDLAWTAATDDATPSAQLQYSVWKSLASGDLSTLAAAEANGEKVVDWSVGITSASLTNLIAGVETWIGVLVRDAQGNVSGYQPVKVSVPSLPFIELSATVLQPVRHIVASDEVSQRKVDITTNADSLECSSDDGLSWQACPSMTTWTWDVANFAATHRIRATKALAVNNLTEVSFTPSQSWGTQRSLVTCTVEVTANESFDAFETRFVDNAVICLADGVRITNSGSQGSIAVTESNVTVLARSGQSAVIENPRTDADVVTLEISGEGNRFSGLTVESDNNEDVVRISGEETVFDHVRVESNASSNNAARDVVEIDAAPNIRLRKSELVGLNANGMQIGGVTGLRLIDMSVQTVNGGTGIFFGSGGRFELENSTVSSWGAALAGIGDSTIGTRAQVSYSVLESKNTGNNANAVSFSIGHADDYLLLQSTTVRVSGSGDPQSAALYVDGDNGIVSLVSSRFERLNTGGGANGPAIVLVGLNSSTNVLYGSSMPSLFCQKVAGGKTFSKILENSATGAATQANFSESAQQNAGAILVCPSGT